MKFKIELRFDWKASIEIEGDSLKDALEKNKTANLSGANLSWANLSGADLSWANLSEADLSWANLSGANLDFSCWSLSCKSLRAKIDKRLFIQLLYHTIRAGQSVDDPEVKKICGMKSVQNLANQFHRVDECGKIETGKGKA